ncbi:MAG: hypothetical protein RI894_1356, partial [Bacteroidota bacterium]
MILLCLLKNKQEIARFSLSEEQTLTIGREGADIRVDDTQKLVSRAHGLVFTKDGGVFFTDTSSGGSFYNAVHFKNKTIEIQKGEGIVELAKSGYEIKVSMVAKQAENRFKGFENPEIGSYLTLLNQKGRLTIGRDSGCDICLDAMTISRQHAYIERSGSGFILYDKSKNGVFVNGQRIDKQQAIKDSDAIQLGSFQFSLVGKLSNRRTDKSATAIEVRHLEKVYFDKEGKPKAALHPISFKIPSQQFVALMGPSGCGKSTLLKCMNGDSPATKGQVFIEGLELNTANFELLKRNIGYVPQDDIVHRELSINDTLYYAAKLRMAEDVSDAEISKRISDVLKTLNIRESTPLEDAKLRNKPLSALSGGQRKRISIAVELLTKPSILFLDEPTSPLDPQTIDEFLDSIRNLTNEGTTVVMVTHKPDDLEYIDTIMMLGTGGYTTFFGTKTELLPYFSQTKVSKVYETLSKSDQAQRLYHTWINANPDHSQIMQHRRTRGFKRPKIESSVRQLRWLSQRYFHLKWNDKENIGLLLAQPIIIGILMSFIFAHLTVGALFLSAISAIWFGVSNAAKEIVDEQYIYKRERMINLQISTYLVSKILILSFIAAMQITIFTAILTFKYSGDLDSVNLHNYGTTTLFLLL